MHFYRASVLRPSNGSVEVWATPDFVNIPKVALLIEIAEHLKSLARSCQVVLHLPDGRVFGMLWDPDMPIDSMRQKACDECGGSFERYRLQCLGRDVLGSTVGMSGILPGDIVDAVAV